MRPGVQRRAMRRLQRARIGTADELDLHGATVARARGLVARFLEGAVRRQRSCVRIIHGKGLGSGTGVSVLRRDLERWLPEHPLVLAWCKEPDASGGSGALRVLLRRAEAPPERPPPGGRRMP